MQERILTQDERKAQFYTEKFAYDALIEKHTPASPNPQPEVPNDDSWLDELFAEIPEEPVTDEQINDMWDREQARCQRFYQAAKAKFETLHPASRPDSLTRRGEILILRRNLNGTYQKHLHDWYIEDWRNSLVDLFDKGITFCKSEIDDRKHLRIWFLLDTSYAFSDEEKKRHEWIRLHDGSLCYGEQSDVDYLSWVAERDKGGY